MKHDILTTEDVTLLVKTFYTNLMLHEEVKPIFAHVDFEKQNLSEYANVFHNYFTLINQLNKYYNKNTAQNLKFVKI